ncbi:tRNA uridine-5-carboxymethylaminomethyl(34) synthesis GTPase MnmE [Peptococcaceae bacterium 1198_IL3148]
MLDDTIAAIATPLGEGGIGIVRISGSESIEIAKKIFKPKYNNNWHQGPGFRVVYGHVIDKNNQQPIDEVLLTIMRGPKSFTGEDVIEINCHGGILPLRKILNIVLKNGAVLAEPGEFSKRAFLNGRLDLAQAESIINIIRSKTEKALEISMGQLQGRLSTQINILQNDLLGILAQIEAKIDFPEDDIDEVTLEDVVQKCSNIKDDLNKLIASADNGKIYQEGVKTVIVGKPNVGKSSILNALTKENRAIVTEIPGTTRDIIEEIININGIPLKIIDTAGLRETDDLVERIGVERSRELINEADLILFVVDASLGLKEEDYEIIKLIENKKIMVIINKIDVKDVKIDRNQISKLLPGPIIEISALYAQGLECLEQQIAELILGGQITVDDQVLVTSARHKQALEKARDHVQEIINGIKADVPGDIVSIDVKSAWEALGEITGTTVGEDLVDKIFKDFCIGK